MQDDADKDNMISPEDTDGSTVGEGALKFLDNLLN